MQIPFRFHLRAWPVPLQQRAGGPNDAVPRGTRHVPSALTRAGDVFCEFRCFSGMVFPVGGGASPGCVVRGNRAAATAWAGVEPEGDLHNSCCRREGPEGLGGGGGGKGARGGEGALTIRPGMPLRDGTAPHRTGRELRTAARSRHAPPSRPMSGRNGSASPPPSRLGPVAARVPVRDS